MLTWKQYRKSAIEKLMAEVSSHATRELVEMTVGNIGGAYWNIWRDEALAAIVAGENPTQHWVNTVVGNGVYGWWECFLKHDPRTKDRLMAAGLSLYYSRKKLGEVAQAYRASEDARLSKNSGKIS